MSKNTSSQDTRLLQRFLDQMPEDVVGSLTREQMRGIHAALRQNYWQRHSVVNIRLTIPVLWKRFYFVLLAGPELRNPERLRANRTHYRFWTPGNLGVVSGLLLLGALGALGLFQLQKMTLSPPASPQIHPASVPFKANKADCEKSGRLWQGQECLDESHSPAF